MKFTDGRVELVNFGLSDTWGVVEDTAETADESRVGVGLADRETGLSVTVETSVVDAQGGRACALA